MSTFKHGAKSSITTSAVALAATSGMAGNGILVKAANSNTGTVYVGVSSAVTAGTLDATDGFELGAGESVQVELNDPSKIYVIGSASGQKVFWVAV